MKKTWNTINLEYLLPHIHTHSHIHLLFLSQDIKLETSPKLKIHLFVKILSKMRVEKLR